MTSTAQPNLSLLAHAQVDLHCHSTASDGCFSPSEMMAHAAQAGIRMVALTDHDTVNGLAEAEAAAHEHQMHFIPGVEISVLWQNKTLHIVGLNFDPQHPALSEALTSLQQQRLSRAETIATRMEKIGATNVLAEAKLLAGNGQLTRTHFARVLVAQGLVSDMKQAFKKHLGAGKPGDVKMQWVSLEQAITAIHASGGVAVLAHPLRYKLSGAWRRRMLMAFSEAGGDGLEVSAGASQQAHDLALCTADALEFGLCGSMASDFHGPEQAWIRYGRLAPLSTQIQPIWDSFQHQEIAASA